MRQQRQAQAAHEPGSLRRSTRLKRKREEKTECEQRDRNSSSKLQRDTIEPKRAPAGTTKPKPAARKANKGKIKTAAEASNKPAARAAGTVDEHDIRNVPELTDSYVRSLLPGAMFGLADKIFECGLWSVDHENNLRSHKFTGSDDFAQFCDAQAQMYQQVRVFEDGDRDDKRDRTNKDASSQDAELRLWEVLQHRFRCGLDDFFRYGLRPSLGNRLTSSPGETFTQYCIKLTAILMHPIWAPSHLAHVRWLLQRIVQERVPGHIRPLAPPYSYDRRPFIETARQWGFEASMRMSMSDDATLEREREKMARSTGSSSGGSGGSDGSGGDDHCDSPAADSAFVGLATASREASKAAVEAEAELAHFFFHASAPRDFYWLDRQLMPLYEPGGEFLDECEDEETGEDEGGSGESSPNPYGLEVAEAFFHGGFRLADSYDDFEQTERQEGRRREDNTINPKQYWEQHDEGVGEGKGKGKESTYDTNLRDDQVFFDLRAQDLDRLLGLMSQPEFLMMGGFRTPDCYLTGYIRAHETFGYGPQDRKEEDKDMVVAPKPPFLTCLQCARRYHQGRREITFMETDDDSEKDDDEDHRDDHSDHNHHHHNQKYGHDQDPEYEQSQNGHDKMHEHQNDDPDHGHFIHQQFVRDVDPSRALEWLINRKCEWLLSGYRECEIRKALKRENGNSVRADGMPLSLPDIPPFDPPPLAQFDRTFTHPSQLAVLDRAIDGPHASQLWCLNNGDDRGAWLVRN